jgi:ATP-binding cassette, subfamily B, bacterial
MMHGGAGFGMARGFKMDPNVTKQKLKPGTIRRIARYARPYRLQLSIFLFATAVDASITVVNPLLLRALIDRGIIGRDEGIVILIALIAVGAAVFDAFLGVVNRWFSSRLGEGLIYDLRTQVFDHVQRQPIAFFTRAQTGSLVSRLDGDVVGAQSAIVGTLSSVVSNVLSVIVILITMFYLSWVVSLIALVLIPLFLIPVRLVGRRLQRLSREAMQLNAEMGSTMTERFNVAGAMLAKLYGRPREELDLFSNRAARVRDIGVVQAMYGSVLFISLTLLASMATAMIYGVGGWLAVGGAFQIGTLVALTTLLNRLYGPIMSLSNVQVTVMTALVSFDRVFEVLDLKPLIGEKPDAVALPAGAVAAGDGHTDGNGHSQGNGHADGNGHAQGNGHQAAGAPGAARLASSAPAVEFEHVSFRYPQASEVSLASLESIAAPTAERAEGTPEVLHDITFRAAPGTLTALVGPSGAGKTTITHLVSRLYDAGSGTVRIGGYDVRDLTLDSLHAAVGVVTQDSHLFHETIRSNLAYARPDASERELILACQAAQIWDLVSQLPDGLDTVVGDRGYRLSGGEKQRVAIARLLLKAPEVVVLDEATAHLDSESEAAVQRALATALAGRTSLVIAHRLSTIRQADQILVIDAGRVLERGTHDELLAAGGLYAELYHTQFARQEPMPGFGRGKTARAWLPGDNTR